MAGKGVPGELVGDGGQVLVFMAILVRVVG